MVCVLTNYNTYAIIRRGSAVWMVLVLPQGAVMEPLMVFVVVVLAFVASMPFCRLAKNGHATKSALLVCAVAVIVSCMTAHLRSWSVLDWLPVIAFCVMPAVVVSRVLSSRPRH